MKFAEIFNDLFVSSNAKFVLNEKEKHLASIVHPIVVKELQLRKKYFKCEDPTAFRESVEAARSNLKHIIELFEQADEAKKEFMQCFPPWASIRKSNVENLKDLASCIHLDRRNSNISRLVGSSVGITGTGVFLTSLLFPPAALTLVIVGSVTAALGGATVFGTSATEIGLLKTKTKKAQAVLTQDKEDFDCMLKWFQHTNELVFAVETVIGFESMRKIIDDLSRFTKDFSSWNTNGFKAKLSTCLNSLFLAERIFQVNFNADVTSMIITVLVVIVLLRSNNHFVFDCVVLTHRLVFGLLTGLDLGVEVGRGITILVRGSAAAAGLSANAARAITHGVFAGVGIALDVVNIVFNSIDIHKGSVSEQGTEIEAAAETLDEELKLITDVYNEMRFYQFLSRLED